MKGSCVRGGDGAGALTQRVLWRVGGGVRARKLATRAQLGALATARAAAERMAANRMAANGVALGGRPTAGRARASSTPAGGAEQRKGSDEDEAQAGHMDLSARSRSCVRRDRGLRSFAAL